ncbi:hypothetical protein ZWY2020_020039 [Hordeum vulgare]|nr:hypothetical protein ZWY2020_020039 [Hordeum vulgare]
MAAQAWKTRFRERVVEAEARCRMIPVKIVLARALMAGLLGVPLVGRTQNIKSAELSLQDAASDLYTAASLLGSATELAHYGGGAELAFRGRVFIPFNRLGTIGLLPAAHRLACEKLLDARLRAADAYDAVERCCGHLMLMRGLLGFPSVTGVDERIDAERLEAHNLLGNARGMADDCVRLVAGALEDVPT